MCVKDELERAEAYFTNPNHARSFELLEGEGRVMFSAPHAVVQTRNGRVKFAERYTGMLCLLIHRHGGFPCLYKTRHLHDDANHDPFSEYRDVLCRYARAHGIRYVLDLHQLKPERPMALCVGTGYGGNLLGDTRALPALISAFQARNISPITVDDPFAAAGEHTVSATVARCGVTALQLELNTRLFVKDDTESRFLPVLEALLEVAGTLAKHEGM